ncbi:MAG: hypothetical protein ACLGGW_08200 [Gammaproteobacteria bacterium]
MVAMIIKDTPATRRIGSITRDFSQISVDDQAQPPKKVARTIARETLDSEQSRQIVYRCSAIDQEIPLIGVNARKALSSYLVDNQIHNPGLLSPRQEGLCAWTLLEHVARKDDGFQKINSNLVSSYIRPTEKPRFESIAKSMNLDPSEYIK